MKTSVVSALLLVSALMVPVVLSTVVAAQSASPPNGESEVRRLNNEEVEAFLKNDRAAMARLWSDDFVVTNPLNRFVTKQQVLGMVDSGFLVITKYDRRIEYVHQYGDVFIVAGAETVVWGGKMPNAGKTEHLRFTGIWAKQPGGWQQIARHANVIP
jgi:ketosteroid isomerase-like protein